ncbi:hypothetical protein [Prosthecobacter fusiformis]|nr:hypothetical protein [Prosthecobacter fusiformis]
MTRLFFFLSLAALLSSCSHSFNKEWNAALKAGPQPGIAGAWEGTWQSDINKHHGRLRSVVGPAKNSAGDHPFHYRATWAGFLSGGYRVDHRVTGSKNTWQFNGQHQMPGWAGGLYTYEGTVKGDEFSATYKCELDEGTFRMKRVK